MLVLVFERMCGVLDLAVQYGGPSGLSADPRYCRGHGMAPFGQKCCAITDMRRSCVDRLAQHQSNRPSRREMDLPNGVRRYKCRPLGGCVTVLLESPGQ
jgi:hypothetical protein